MFKTGLRFRVLKSFGAAVLDQIMLSAANFIAGFLLIRNASDANYGMYVLVQSGVLLVLTAQSAWLSGPLSILAPKRSPEARRAMIGAVEGTQRRFLQRAVVAALCVPVIGFALHVWSPVAAAVVAMGILAGWTALNREFLRRALLIYSRAHTVLGMDAIYVGVFLVGVFVAVYALPNAVIWAVAAMCVAGWAGSRAGHRAFGREPGWEAGDATGYLKELRRLGIWTTVGALAYWLFSQSYNYVLVTRLDLKAVADVNASRLLIMPAMVFTIGLESLLAPKTAGWLADIGIKALYKRMIPLFLGIAALELGYCLLVLVFRNWLARDFLHKSIADLDHLLLFWTAIALIGVLRLVVQSALLALESMKVMAGLTALSATISLIVMWFGVNRWGAAGVLVGQITGDSVLIIGYAGLLRREWLNLAHHAPAPR